MSLFVDNFSEISNVIDEIAKNGAWMVGGAARDASWVQCMDTTLQTLGLSAGGHHLQSKQVLEQQL